MSIILNSGSNPSAVTYKGTSLTRVVCDGVVVWPNASSATWRDANNLGITVTGANHLNPFISSDDTPLASYTVTLPSLTYVNGAMSDRTYQPASGSPLWSNGSGGGSLAANSFNIVDVPYSWNNGSSGTYTILFTSFENGVLTLGRPYLPVPSGATKLVTQAVTRTVSTYLYTP